MYMEFIIIKMWFKNQYVYRFDLMNKLIWAKVRSELYVKSIV